MRVLLAPREAFAAAVASPRPVRITLWLLFGVTLLGALTLPRQLPMLHAVLHGPGAAEHAPLMYAGLRRLVVLDRLVPPLTPVLAGLLVHLLAGAWLPQSPEARVRRAAVVVLGLAPLLLLRFGELLVVWLVPASGLPAGEIVTLPRWFATGPVGFLARGSVPPALDLLDARVNLVTAWVVALWVLGLRTLDDAWGAWQVMVPVMALAVAGAFTWWLGMPAIALVLGVP